MEKYTAEETRFLIKLGNNLRKTRKARGITQQKVAAVCNCEKANLSRIESGKTNVTVITLKKVADAIGVPLAEILAVNQD